MWYRRTDSQPSDSAFPKRSTYFGVLIIDSSVEQPSLLISIIGF